MEAVGMLEVFGLATAFAAADAGCKAGNVRLENFDKNKPANADELPVPLIVMVKFRGQVADVEAALEAATAKAESMTGIVTKYKISRPTEDTEKMLKLNAFDKGNSNGFPLPVHLQSVQSCCSAMSQLVHWTMKPENPS